MGVIRNQRLKIHRLELVSTVKGPSRKILKVDCRVIKHAQELYTFRTAEFSALYPGTRPSSCCSSLLSVEEASSLGNSGTGRHVAPACLRWKKYPLLVVVGQVVMLLQLACGGRSILSW